MGSCNGCGDCCSPVHVKGGVTKDNSREDYLFAQVAFHEITDEEVLRRRPWLPVDALRERGYVFYRCDFFDEESRQCMAYDQRPPLCRNFPWYGREPSDTALMTLPRCSYWEDIPEERRPRGVPVEFIPRDSATMLQRR